MHHVEPMLEEIQVPALVVQSSEDPVVNPSGSWRVFDLLGSKHKQYVVFNFKRHGILLGEGSLRVHQTIGDFVDRLPLEEPGRSAASEK
jgi:esterase/lipase